MIKSNSINYSVKISVIIPVYKVEKFIARCATSLMEQTLDSVEYIFVNDASPDSSIDILKGVLRRYTKLSRNVKILNHAQNKGLPAARNTGLSVASGEYVFHCDSDDFLEKNTLQILYEKAKDTDADFVYCDFYISSGRNERYMTQPKYDTARDALKGMLSGQMKYNVWNKLVKRRLYLDNGISFPNGHSMGEDMTMLCVAACAKSVAYINQPLYHYVRDNANALTQKFSYKQIEDINFNVERTMAFLDNLSIDMGVERSFFKLNVKLPLLITDDWDSYRCWNSWFPETNMFIRHNSNMAIRTRLLQEMANKRFYVGVWLYYQIVYRIIYNMLYK